MSCILAHTNRFIWQRKALIFSSILLWPWSNMLFKSINEFNSSGFLYKIADLFSNTFSILLKMEFFLSTPHPPTHTLWNITEVKIWGHYLMRCSVCNLSTSFMVQCGWQSFNNIAVVRWLGILSLYSKLALLTLVPGTRTFPGQVIKSQESFQWN